MVERTFSIQKSILPYTIIIWDRFEIKFKSIIYGFSNGFENFSKSVPKSINYGFDALIR